MGTFEHNLMMSGRGFTKKHKFDEDFQILDVDKDGLITENDLKTFFINENIIEASQKEIDILMKTLDVNLNGQINLVEYAARAKEFVKKRILLTYLLRLKARVIAPHLLTTSDFKAHVLEADVSGILTMEDINFFVKIVDRKGNGTINIKEDMDFAFFHY